MAAEPASSVQPVQASTKEYDEGALTAVNQYTLLRPLGKGSFAEVFLCKDATSKEFALKLFNKSVLRRKRTIQRTSSGVVVHSELDKVEREIAIMKKLQHANLVSLHEVIDDTEEDALYLILELVTFGPVMTFDAVTHVFSTSLTADGALPPALGAAYLLDIAAGLKYLHLHHVAHRDLKPDNVLRARDGSVKIADFGVAHHFKELSARDVISIAKLERSKSRAQISNTEGTYCFWAPEMLSPGAFNAFACDLWAAGVCFFIFNARTLPFYEETAPGLFESIAMAAPRYAAATFSKDAQRVCEKLLQPDVDVRATVGDLEDDSWLAQHAGAHVVAGGAVVKSPSATVPSPLSGLGRASPRRDSPQRALRSVSHPPARSDAKCSDAPRRDSSPPRSPARSAVAAAPIEMPQLTHTPRPTPPPHRGSARRAASTGDVASPLPFLGHVHPGPAHGNGDNLQHVHPENGAVAPRRPRRLPAAVRGAVHAAYKRGFGFASFRNAVFKERPPPAKSEADLCPHPPQNPPQNRTDS